ncbi:SDR family NAD(P)-dependent oxidoreductase [Salinarimonas sp. NSM]|uniref:SDR family NAD(P)-dependent oxidoreductase n=1 Tax=Salinarimonas sp. NSM TaxID=3458003 RepID=UPI004036CF2E
MRSRYRGHALVTGASSGIGAAIAERLIRDGWRVTGLDREPPRSSDLRSRAILVDLADGDALDGVLDVLVREGDAPVAIVHAAGLMRSDASAGHDEPPGLALWSVHVAAAHRLVERLAPSMPDGRGRVVVLSSRAGDGRAGRALYAASKAALTGLVRSWAAALVPRGVTVNAIAPATVDTPMLRDPARADAPIAPLPIGRIIRPDEIAALAALLLSEDGGAITGQVLTVCGGASLPRAAG